MRTHATRSNPTVQSTLRLGATTSPAEKQQRSEASSTEKKFPSGPGFDFAKVPIHAPKAASQPRALEATRSALAASFGEGARQVPIHHASSVEPHAEGFTRDGQVHLAPGRFETGSYEGRVRLGHEVAHAVQQQRGVGLRTSLLPGERARLENEAETAGHAFASGHAFAVRGRAPASVSLFRGLGERPRAQQELDDAFRDLWKRRLERDKRIREARAERHAYLKAHSEWFGAYVEVDEALRKMSPLQQQYELSVRFLQRAFLERSKLQLSRAEAERIMKRMHWAAFDSANAISERIRTSPAVYYQTRDLAIAFETYNEIFEDEQRASRDIDEELNTGPDMALEIFKDVGRGYYNGAIGFGQGLLDLPLAPYNLYKTARGQAPSHTIDITGLEADYETDYGDHFGSSIAAGTQIGLGFAFSAALEGPSAADAAKAATAANTASQLARTARVIAALSSKVVGFSAGATALLQAGIAIRDLARGYVIENGVPRPLTDDDIINDLTGIVFGAQTAVAAFKGGGKKPNAATQAEAAPTVAAPEVVVEHPNPGTIVVKVPGHQESLVIDGAGWRIEGVAGDQSNVPHGPPEEAAALARRIDDAQAAAEVTPAEAAPVPVQEEPTARAPKEEPPPQAPQEELPSKQAKADKPPKKAKADKPPKKAKADKPPKKAKADKPLKQAKSAPQEIAEEASQERTPSAREEARIRLREEIDQAKRDAAEAKTEADAEWLAVVKLKDRIRALEQELANATGDEKARIEKELDDANFKLNKEDEGGAAEGRQGAAEREYKARRRVKELEALFTYDRPTLSEETKQKIQNKAIAAKLRMPPPDNRWIDPNTKSPINDTPVYGHVWGKEHRRLAIDALDKRMTQAEFNAWVNENPDWFQIESKASNESHRYEKPGID